jgi:hypothetical protein
MSSLKLDIPSLGVLSIDFEYVRIPRKVFSEIQVGDNKHQVSAFLPSFVKTTWKLKTICNLAVGETIHRSWVWKASSHEHGFNLKEERKRALAQALHAMFPKEPHRETRRLIWAALHAQGFHPFLVSRVDRLTKMLEAAKKKAERRAEKAAAHA